MPVLVRYFTDPACSASWMAEPVLRRLQVEFGDQVSFTYVMGGLARDYTQGYEDAEAGIGGSRGVYPGLVAHWLTRAEEGRMPIDPRLWIEAPIASTYPACMAVKAAAEQAADGGGGYLRGLREGLMCFRRKLDTTEALVEEARRARLDVERFRIDLGSHAIVEAFAADLEETREIPPEARERGGAKAGQTGERLTLPTMAFVSEDGERRWVFGLEPYEAYREAAEAAGAAASGGPLGVPEALRRFGRLATTEIEAVCDLPAPRAEAELWRLAAEWKARPVRVLTGYLWEPA
jgi:predicted DsbA family dithiol-disulfide isomerase